MLMSVLYGWSSPPPNAHVLLYSRPHHPPTLINIVFVDDEPNISRGIGGVTAAGDDSCLAAKYARGDT